MSEKTTRRARKPPANPKPPAIEKPIMATLLLDANELGLLLQMLRQPWLVPQLLEPPIHKHIAANLQAKGIEAAEVFPNPNGDQPG